jgi:hypothetical protein
MIPYLTKWTTGVPAKGQSPLWGFVMIGMEANKEDEKRQRVAAANNNFFINSGSFLENFKLVTST